MTVGVGVLVAAVLLAFAAVLGTAAVSSRPVLFLSAVALYGRLAEDGFDVHVYDQVGAGRSGRLADPSAYGVARGVADLESVRVAIGADRMTLVGHSAGAVLAGHYLAAHPTRVERLVLTSPGALDPTDTGGDLVTTGLDTGRRARVLAATLAPRALLGYALLQVDPRAAHAYLGDAEADARNDAVLIFAVPGLHCSGAEPPAPVRGSGFYALQFPQSATAPARPDVRAALDGLPVPALILKGSCDYLSWRSALDYRAALPGSVLLHLPGTGHDLQRDRPDDVLAAARAFLLGEPLPLPPHPDAAVPADYRGPP